MLKSGRHNQAFYRNLWTTICNGEDWHGEIVNRRKDGVLYTEKISIAPVKDAIGAITHFIAVREDVTERKKIDEAMHTSETRYRRLFETAQDGILLLDADTATITDANPFLMDLLGYTREEIVRRKLCEIASFKDSIATREAFETLQDSGYIRYKDLPLQTKSGNNIDVEFVST